MPQTFYDLKHSLHFPTLVGRAAAIADLPALEALNREEAALYDEAARKSDRAGIVAQVTYRACRRLADLHLEDAVAIRAFIKSRGGK